MTAGLPGVEPVLISSRQFGLDSQVESLPAAPGARRRLFLIVAATLALAACGGDDDGGSASSNSPENPSGENRAPTISGSPPSQVLVDGTLDFTPNAADADGDDLTFTVDNLPSWASFDTATGRLSGTPGEGDVRSYTGIEITVSDGTASASLAPFTIDVVVTGTGSATLTWTAPTQKTDGTPVDLAGFKVYWGTSSRNYTESFQIDSPGSLTHVVDGLTPATWYFAVTAIDSQGLESAYSNEATKQIM